MEQIEKVKELRGPDSPFPTAVERIPERKPLDAYQMASPIRDRVDFGMDSKNTAKVLRDIADRIEAGEYLLQSGGVFTFAVKEDFPMTCVNVKFHAMKANPEVATDQKGPALNS